MSPDGTIQRNWEERDQAGDFVPVDLLSDGHDNLFGVVSLPLWHSLHETSSVLAERLDIRYDRSVIKLASLVS